MLSFIEPERSSTRRTSAGSWLVLEVWLPQLASPVGADPEIPAPPEPPFPDALASSLITGEPAVPPPPPPFPSWSGEPQPTDDVTTKEKIVAPATSIV